MNIWRTISFRKNETEYQSILRHRAIYKLRATEAKAWVVGFKVTPMTGWYLSERNGTRMNKGEVGTITRVTRTTIDVMGPHGLMRSRPRNHFKPADWRECAA